MKTISFHPKVAEFPVVKNKTGYLYPKIIFKKFIFKAIYRYLQFSYRLLMLHPSLMKLRYAKGFEKARWNAGKIKAWGIYLMAQKNVPAYKKFYKNVPGNNELLKTRLPELTYIPETDKENYVKKYSIAERCKKGVIPFSGIVFDESSGSSGIPTNWLRSLKEREENQKIIRMAVNILIPDKNKFIINSFALGPWATGMNISFAFEKTNLLKSLGPDERKIVNTLKLFGTDYHYLIMGYPPFLKNLSDNKNLDWAKYKVTFIFGGEAMSEPMRRYILDKGVKKVYGSYGASDLDLNLSAENDFTISLRKILLENKNLAKRLLKHDGAIPMIFQYNPADFFIETNSESELLITLCRNSYLAPKVRYNIHDLGQIVRLPELESILKEFNLSVSDIGELKTDLPFLFHYGRADMAVAYYGCKVKPGDLQECIFKIGDLGNVVNGFSIKTVENERCVKKLIIDIELKHGLDPEKYNDGSYLYDLIAKLKEINQDFRESIRMVPAEGFPELHFHKFHSQHFSENDYRIKNKYIF
jgi:phenylacetate-CoA ligase